MAVAIEPGGMEARARGLEFGMLGEADKGTAFYTLAVFENRYVKQNDIWRIREMRMFPLMKTEYAQGWAKSQVVDPPPDAEPRARSSGADFRRHEAGRHPRVLRHRTPRPASL